MHKLMESGNVTDQRDYNPFDVEHSYKDTHVHKMMMSEPFP